MRIATKVIAGYALLIGIMIALVTYQTMSARRMQATVARLSSADFRGGRLALELLRTSELIEEYAGKSFVLADPDYARQVRSFADDFERVRKEMRPVLRSSAAIQRYERLTRLWQECDSDLAMTFRRPSSEWPPELPPRLDIRLGELETQVQGLYQAILDDIDAEVESSRRSIRRMELVSLYVAGLALVLTSAISYLIGRSITKPLRKLSAATRAVGEGRFGSHPDVSGNDEFSELSRDFASMMRRLGELDTLKKDFVSHVSHELKSPLASMQDNIRLLLDQVPGTLNDKQKRLLSLNLQSARRLSAMIFNLLDISRLEAGAMKYDMDVHDLCDLVRTAVAEVEPRARERGQSFQTQLASSLLIDCDRDRIVQVLVNLLDNAVKFSPPDGTIEVSAGPMSEKQRAPAGFRRGADQEYALIEVRDRGPGVPIELREKIFEKFHQTSKTGRVPGQGVGLGLAIARTIVEAHRGMIWAAENPEGGSCFAFVVPSRRRTRQAVSAPI